MKRPSGMTLQTWDESTHALGKFDFHACTGEGGDARRTQGKKERAREEVSIYNGWVCYLQCWCCCCCIYFAGYQHGLVSKLCVWLRPESRRGREKNKKRIKITKKEGKKDMKKKGEKRNIKIACEVKYKREPVSTKSCTQKMHTGLYSLCDPRTIRKASYRGWFFKGSTTWHDLTRLNGSAIGIDKTRAVEVQKCRKYLCKGYTTRQNSYCKMGFN